MPSRVDLHTHSSASDGTLSPLEVLAHATDLQIRVLALTDHDSTAGYEALMSGPERPPNLRLIPGIELNAEGETSCHLLGYFLNVSDPGLQKTLAHNRVQREVRSRAMVEKLQALGHPITFERVTALAKGGAIGRPHIADALIEAKVTRSRQEAFDRFLKRDGAAFVASDGPSTEESICTIRQAGGVPVLAHPSYYTSKDLLKRLVDQGLMGIEAYYPEHSRGLIQNYLEAAKTYDLVVTGGSDFHGPKTGRAQMGQVNVPEEVVFALEKAKERV